MKVLAKAGQWTVKEVSKKDGKGSFFIVEKSRKNEQSGEWESQSIFLNPGEFPTVAELLLIAFQELVNAQANARNNAQEGGADY